MPKNAVILNSRQGMRPYGDDHWVVNSYRAVQHAAANKYSMLTSVGMKSWELVLYLASKCNLPQAVYVPVEDSAQADTVEESITTQFHLNNKPVEFVIVGGESDKNEDNINRRRDEKIIDEADIIYPVSIRPGGNLDKLINAARRGGKAIIEDFRVTYRDTSDRCRVGVGREEINPEIDNGLKNYLIHWTRAAHHGWPDESAYDYYHDICELKAEYPRSGLKTLIRILIDGKLLASSRHYRRGLSAVAFSSLAPSNAVDLMKWRARYREMTIEPYGVAIEKAYAETLGVKKVFYGNPEMYDYLEEENKPYFQSIGVKGCWIPEKEHRHIGDIDLTFVPSHRMAVIVRDANEKEKIEGIFDGRIYSLCR